MSASNDSALLAECTRSGTAFVPFFPLGGGLDPIDTTRLDRTAARHVMLVASVLRTNRAAWIWSAKTTTQPRPRSSGLAAACRAARMLAGPSGPGHGRVAHRSRHHDRLLAGVQQVEQVCGLLDKSPVAVSTSLPSGRLAAMSPANTDTWLPAAATDGSTPARWAYEDRAAASGRW